MLHIEKPGRFFIDVMLKMMKFKMYIFFSHSFRNAVNVSLCLLF
jgi:hypothetical protein